MRIIAAQFRQAVQTQAREADQVRLMGLAARVVGLDIGDWGADGFLWDEGWVILRSTAFVSHERSQEN